MNFRLYRSRDRIVAGVAGGVADALDIDPSIVRIVWAVAMLAGLPLLLYIVMAIVVPEEPDEWVPWSDRYGPDAASRPMPPGAVPATPDVPPSSPAGSASGSPTAGSPTTADATIAADTATTAGDTGLGGAAAGDASASVPPGPTPAPGHDAWRAANWSEREARRAQHRAERWERRAYRRDGSGAVVFGILLILVGAGFLAHQLVPTLDWDQIWPVVLIAVGVLLVAGAFVRRPAG